MSENTTTERGRITIKGFASQDELSEQPDIDTSGDKQAAQSRLQIAWRKFKTDRTALAGMAIIAVMLLAMVFARPIRIPEIMPIFSGYPVQPFSIAPFPPDQVNYEAVHDSPSATHLFGTDWTGRDIFSRILFGTRWSLSIGVIAVGMMIFIGVPLGAIAGYYGGLIDEFIMRLVDTLYAFPFLVLAIAIVAIIGQGYWNMILALVLVGWISYARLIRGEILSIKENEYVLAAKALGVSNRSIIFRHIVPNAMGPVIVYGTLSIGTTVLAAAALGFLGLGLDPATAEWGSMLSFGRDTLIRGYWWVTFFPGLAIFLFVMAINLVGDGLRDAFDPQSETGGGFE